MSSMTCFTKPTINRKINKNPVHILWKQVQSNRTTKSGLKISDKVWVPNKM